MTLLVRDEADVVDANLAFHLDVGVDLVIGMDHRSSDGTTEILRRYERAGQLVYLAQEATEVRQSEWVTGMARLAATEYGADWVLNTDADEFWWPLAGSLKDALAAVPDDFGVVYAPMCYFLPSRAPGEFYEAMTTRLIQPAPIGNPLGRYRPSVKAVHRGSASVHVHRGNHEVEGVGRRLSSWHPLELLHFPDRSPAQFERKYANTIESWPSGGRDPGAFVVAAHDAVARAGAVAAFEHLALDAARLEAAIADEVVVVDTRLRDALRRLRGADGGYEPRTGSRQPLPLPATVDKVRHAADGQALLEADLIRVARDVDELEARVRTIGRWRVVTSA
jgi:hypothetical protein